jgi:hypothetical protein
MSIRRRFRLPTSRRSSKAMRRKVYPRLGAKLDKIAAAKK